MIKEQLLAQLPFSIENTAILILIGYFMMPISSFAFLLMAWFKKRKGKPFKQALISSFICFSLSIGSYYWTSMNFITTEITGYIIGEETEQLAKKHDIVDVKIYQSANAEEFEALETCDKPIELDGKYISPRLFDIIHCLEK